MNLQTDNSSVLGVFSHPVGWRVGSRYLRSRCGRRQLRFPMNIILKFPVGCGRSPEFWHYVSGDQAERAPALGTNDFPNDR